MELDGVLRKFYAGLRTETGGFHKRSSNIFSQAEFRGSKNALDAVMKKNKPDGLERQVQHKDPITEEDKKRLATTYFEDTLETNDTYKLQFFAWYTIATHFGLRGGEVFAQIRKQDLVLRRMLTAKST